ncbi:hypothetical protein [Fimbriiglobus ruber]|uniref:Putative major tail protein n=1 Tax=Fimbriiglobus ruber TaxID=1908690 RepID=A0A225DFW4_9BACT|nr:hypothetical protein [Fimbriiglobus ruber]OWK34977.1 putative major tail protein [Fimbriiglobus ruber]
MNGKIHITGEAERRLAAAVQFTEGFSRDGFNERPAPNNTRTAGFSDTFWVVHITGPMQLASGNPGSSSDQYYLYPGQLVYRVNTQTTDATWTPIWDQQAPDVTQDCWVESATPLKKDYHPVCQLSGETYQGNPILLAGPPPSSRWGRIVGPLLGTATGTATIGTSPSPVTGVMLGGGGNGYTSPPTITITGGGGSGATATATISGVVSDTTVTSGGTGYTSVPTITFSGGGSTGTAATAIVAAGVVVGITITNPGSGYSSAPTITFSGGGGTGAGATTTIMGPVSGITLTAGGTGYTSAPTLCVAGPPTPVWYTFQPVDLIKGVWTDVGPTHDYAYPTPLADGNIAPPITTDGKTYARFWLSPTMPDAWEFELSGMGDNSCGITIYRYTCDGYGNLIETGYRAAIVNGCLQLVSVPGC